MKTVVAILIGFALTALIGLIAIRIQKRYARRQRRDRRRRWLADRYIWDVVMRRNTSRRLTYRREDEDRR